MSMSDINLVPLGIQISVESIMACFCTERMSPVLRAWKIDRKLAYTQSETTYLALMHHSPLQAI